MKHAKLPIAILTLTLVLSQTACLKTRAQVKGTNGQSAEQDSDAESDNAAATKGSYDVEEIKNEITRISGKLDEVDHNQRGQNFGDLKEYTARLDGRIAELEKNQLLVMTELKALKDKEAQVQAAAAQVAAEPPSNLLNEANKLLATKNYDAAAEKYRAVLAKNTTGKNAAEAFFGLGECEYSQKNYKKAIVQYSKVQEAFAKSSRAPTSLYRIGMSFQHLNMPTDANGFFSEVIERYPKSTEAKKAHAKVKE